MSISVPFIPARYYVRLADLLIRHGVDFIELLHHSDIQPSSILEPDALLSLTQVEQLIKNVLQQVSSTDLAIDLGKSLKLSSHHILGYGILTSSTIEQAMRFVSRYFRLIMPTFRMYYVHDQYTISFRFQPVLPMTPACLAFHLEAIAVAFHFEVKELLEHHLPNYHLYFSIPEPAHIKRYDELGEARCHFGWENTPGIRMVFPAEIARHQLPMADPHTLKMIENRCHHEMHQVMLQGKVVDWVIMMLRESSDGLPCLNDLARFLNLSTRTLDRHLKQEGKSFRELSKMLRHEKALNLLQEQQMNIGQIAYELGYSEPANFTRAFKANEGISPQQYRGKFSGIPS